MARLTGTNVSSAEAWAYENLISHWTSIRFYRYRNRFLRRRLGYLGPQSNVSFGVRILDAEKVHIGRRSSVNNQSVLDGRSGLTIGDNTLIGFETIIVTYTHAMDQGGVPINQQGMVGAPVTIGDNVWVGCRVVILPGVTIGNDSVIGAGSVVTQDIPAGSVAAGVPARPISRVPGV